MGSNMKNLLFSFFVALSLIASVWSSAAYAEKLHSFTHEELEDHRQENVVKNMHFADDVMRTKFWRSMCLIRNACSMSIMRSAT